MAPKARSHPDNEGRKTRPRQIARREALGLGAAAAAAAGAAVIVAFSSEQGAVVAQQETSTPTPAVTPTPTATPFPTVGSVPEGANTSNLVSAPFVTSNSHVSVTLTTDPGGGRSLAWVELLPGSGFRVHLTSGPPPMRPETGFSFRVL